MALGSVVCSLPFLLVALFASGTWGGGSLSGDDLVAELETLRSQSPSGVIRLDDRLVSRFLTSAPVPRPYHLLIFFDAASLRSKPELHLPQLRSEFAIVSQSFAAHHSGLPTASKLFFCELEFGDSQSSFSLFGVNSLPHVRIVSPSTRVLLDSEAMESSAFARLADSMAEFVESKSKLSVGPIIRPPPVSPRQIVVLLLVLLVASPFIMKKIVAGETMLHDSRVWMAGAVFVYFFSVSGSMHNIIRNMPMMLNDRDGRPVFFYQGSGMQLGAEGIIVGFLYTLVGLVLAFVTHGLVRLRRVAAQQGMMFVAMVVVYWAVGKVISLDNWKTGYSIHAFWPTSWK
ncbi:putative dolichyl-diphosphooligosaccharide--protein glycosyltransferase subunit 3B [Apostasia shenzhenica]|uniref:Putative dolichyl-diphosphooligosaccharide--protein glycosyltransferase subunit 3B n=1 Tax=Apostasia shenzhenica TaxID=1088818 RepID=A0A2H9ZSZ3_9ASPA|nr:putative dolichyl-diphosphooligosaccharide--protein glycosyltransferase subunit 3B [Apostasia shenzhenica]